jgi:hypothetical protein
LLIFGSAVAALACSVVAAALPACWFMNEYSFDNQFKALEQGLERHFDEESRRNRKRGS